MEPCCGSFPLPLAPLDDAEGEAVPRELPPVVDAHVHVFHDRILAAMRAWFEKNAWHVRYPLAAAEIAPFLLGRGVRHVVALHYAHKPGIARSMNTFVAEVAKAEPRVVATATVHPDDPDPAAILAEAKALGARGVKLHCHVQAFAPDDARLEPIYAACEGLDLPLVLHAGREPKTTGYPVDPYEVCSAERTERVLRAHPRLRLVVPHLGCDEYDPYLDLVTRFDNLWLDTTMAIAGFFPIEVPWRLVDARPERVLYGTDFPNLPYAWDRELARLHARKMPEAALAAILGGNAAALFGLQL